MKFEYSDPYPHSVIDDFFPEEVALRLEAEFPEYDSPIWYIYDNAVEHKKTCNNWNLFPPLTYTMFQQLTVPDGNLVPDHGLHGGGWHIHGVGGNLNPHLDYVIHPKLKLQRKANLIVYLSSSLKPEHGGYFGFWKDGVLVKEVEPKFNRAVFFDTTDAWHGMSRKLNVPEGIYRKSIAVYFLCEPNESGERERALFAPRDDQKNDPSVLELIERRAKGIYK